jgi:hypothetical protein
MPTRRLTFAVGTSLLTASLAAGTVGCKSQPTANPGPEPPHVNEGPAPDEPTAEEPAPEEEPAPDEIVNTVPSEPSEPNVNTVPE